MRLWTESIWTDLLPDLQSFLNPLYLTSSNPVISPSHNIRSLQFWTNLYLRWYEDPEDFVADCPIIELPRTSVSGLRNDILASSLGYSAGAIREECGPNKNLIATERLVSELERQQAALDKEIQLRKQQIEQLRQRVLLDSDGTTFLHASRVSSGEDLNIDTNNNGETDAIPDIVLSC